MGTHPQLSIFRVISFIEGISYLLLLFIAMPLKYLAGMPEYVRMVGMAHGLLFVGYMISAALACVEQGWSFKMYLKLFAVSIIPFGIFYSEKHWLKPGVKW